MEQRTDDALPSVVPAVVWLTSGQELRIDQIALYERKAVAEVMDLRARAAKVFGPALSGVGVGVLGMPSVTFAAEAAAIGIISSFVANAAQRSALESLIAAQGKLTELLKKPFFIEVGIIDQIASPVPEAWHAIAGDTIRNVNMRTLSRGDSRELMARYNKTDADIIDGYLKVADPRHVVHSTHEFVIVRSEGREIAVRWNQVVSWQPPAAG